MTGQRCLCCVPFCARWTAGDPDKMEYLCPDHWKLADRRRKRWLRLIKRRIDHGQDPEHNRWVHSYHWERARKQAIERAFGITA